MLRVTTTTSAADAKRYYTEGLSRQDYYTKGQEIPGHWQGKAAARLGLSGQVNQATFFALAENRNPQHDGPLTVRQKDNRRVGYDFTFSAPKSVGLLYAMTGDARILQAFRSSVNETMREMETEMQTRVRRGGTSMDRVTGNMVWADFIHTVTRPVDGVPDPDLHAHCYAFNATYDPVEARWKAGQFHDLKRDSPYYEAAFHTRLAHQMKALGFGVERAGKWWDIAGMPRELIEKFSRRSAEINAKAEALGITDAKAKGELGAKTRAGKAEHLSETELQAEWRGRLSRSDRQILAELTEDSSGNSANSGKNREIGQKSGRSTGISPEDALTYAVEHSFDRASVVSEKQLFDTALRRGFGDVLPEDIKALAERGEQDMLTATVDGRKLVTTRQVLAEEQAMLAFARAGSARCVPLCGQSSYQYHSNTLNPDQMAAVTHLLTSPDQVMMLRGSAGTGKTTLMKEAVAEIEKGGKKVYTFAPGTEASRGVLRQEGFTDATTVAALLKNEVMHERLRGNVIWIDEAGQLGIRDMNAVFQLADRLGSRVILSGDTKQHGAVARGDALRLLETEAGIRPAELSAIVRQRGRYRDAVAAIAKGDLAGGFERLDALGCIQEVRSADRLGQLSQDYLRACERGKSVLVVAPTHREGEDVTQLIRSGLKQQGKIGNQDHTFWTLRNLSWTQAERSDAVRYRAGLVVQFFQNAKGIKNGERLRITGKDENNNVLAVATDGQEIILPLDVAARFQVYEPRSLGLAERDTIRITQNGKTEDGHQLNNGALYRIKGFTQDGDILLKNGWEIGSDFGHIAHGYSTTSHASQGKTVDQVFIAQGAASFPASSKEQFYVSISRGREGVRIYTDDKEELKARVMESRQRGSATELVQGQVTARARPIEQERSNRIERFRRFMARLEKVKAAMHPELVKDQPQNQTQERVPYVGPGIER